MTTPRAFVSPEALRSALPGEELTLDPDEAHHIAGVLRLGPGASLALFDGAGRLAEATLHRSRRDLVTVTVHCVTLAPAPTLPVLELLVGLLKADKLDWVVQKTTELGLDRLILVETERSVRRPAPESAARRQKRLLRIAREAARQAGRAYVPALDMASSFVEALSLPGRSGQSPPPHGPTDLSLLLWEQAPHRARLITLLEPVLQATRLRILVGPEGGLTEAEVRLAERHGFCQASLGPHILRAETAAMAACTLAAARVGRLG